jgi:hypothetical protein
MAMTPERRVKNAVRKILVELGAYYAMPVTGGYGNSGAPDFLVCIRGRFVGIECKAKPNTPTPLQLKNLTDIEQAGGVALIVNEDNITSLKLVLDKENKQ